MSSWHYHLASDLWEPLKVERFWSTALQSSADSLHVPRLGKAPTGSGPAFMGSRQSWHWHMWCLWHWAGMLVVAAEAPASSPCRDAQSLRRHRAHPVSQPCKPETLNVTCPLWKSWPWALWKAVVKHLNKLGEVLPLDIHGMCILSY